MIAHLLRPLQWVLRGCSPASHLTRGMIAFCALGLAIVPPWQINWPGFILLPLAIGMLRGCPMCWLTGTVCAFRSTKAPLAREQG